MSELPQLIADFLVICFLCSTRVTIALFVVPFFGNAINGLQRRLMLVVCQAIAVPVLFPTVDPSKLDALAVGLIGVKEAMIGLIMGILAGILFWAIDSAAELIDLQRGATSAGVFNPQFGTVSSPLAGMFSRLISAVFYATGGFMAFLGALFLSYQLYPVTGYFPEWKPDAFQALMGIFENYFRMAILYAAPLLVLFFMIDFGLGLMNRFVPHLNVFFLALPVKSGLAFFMLVFYVGFVVTSFKSNLFTPTILENYLKSVFR